MKINQVLNLLVIVMALTFTACTEEKVKEVIDAQKISCSFNGKRVNHGQSVTALMDYKVSHGETCQSEERVCDNGDLSGSYEYSSCEVEQASACLFNGEKIEHGDIITSYKTSSVPYQASCESEVRTCDNGELSGSFHHLSCEAESAKACYYEGKRIEDGDFITRFENSSVAFGESCTTEKRVCENGIPML